MSASPITMKCPDCCSESVSIAPQVSASGNWPDHLEWFSNLMTAMVNRSPPVAAAAGVWATATPARSKQEINTATGSVFIVGVYGWFEFEVSRQDAGWR